MNHFNPTLVILIAFITAIFGPIIVEWIKHKFFHKKRSDVLEESIINDEKIDNQLEIILNKIKCDRLCISQFHNGGHYYPTGKSIKKFSIFYERTSDKTQSIQEIFQNLPVSLFPKVFSLLNKDGEISIPKCSESEMDCGMLQCDKTKSYYLLSIKDLNNNFIGTLSISYYEKEHLITLDEWIFIRQKLGAIGTILTDYLHDIDRSY